MYVFLAKCELFVKEWKITSYQRRNQQLFQVIRVIIRQFYHVSHFTYLNISKNKYWYNKQCTAITRTILRIFHACMNCQVCHCHVLLFHCHFLYIFQYIMINSSSLKPFSQTYSLKEGGGDFCYLIDLRFVRFGMNVNWTSNFHLILIT